MKVYSITSVVNSSSKVSKESSAYGAAGTWFEIFVTKQEALVMVKKWGAQPLEDTDNIFVKETTDGFKVFYTLNEHYMNEMNVEAVAS